MLEGGARLIVKGLTRRMSTYVKSMFASGENIEMYESASGLWNMSFDYVDMRLDSVAARITLISALTGRIVNLSPDEFLEITIE